MKKEIKNILSVTSSNIYNLVLGIILTLILPKVLLPEQYGYWSLFTLYLSYSGIILFGFCDGIFLRYGGKKYDKLNKKVLSTYAYSLLIYLIFICVLWTVGLNIYLDVSFRFWIMLFIGIGVLLTCFSNYFSIINQVTQRFNIYVRANVITKSVLVILSIVMIFIPNVNALYIIGADILGLIVTCVYYMYSCKTVLKTKPKLNKRTIKTIALNMKIGISVTISSITSMLFVGFGKFFIQSRLDIQQLGYYSFIISISALFTQVISAVTVVLYPMFKQFSVQKIKECMIVINNILAYLSGAILLVYYPATILLKLFYPQYIQAIGSLVFLFPLVIYAAKSSIIYEIAFKALRKEKKLLKIVLISLGINILITEVLFVFVPTIETVALTTVIGYFLWNMVSQYTFFEKSERKTCQNIDVLLVLIYILSNIFMPKMIYSFILVVLSYLILVIVYRKKIKEVFKNLVDITKNNETVGGKNT